jgi:hypothetical protein
VVPSRISTSRPWNDRDYWQKQLREAEAELDAAKTRTALNAAAKRLQLARAELKRLEAKAEKAKPSSRPPRR